nr:hypothetical protein [Vibrio parahaemolyticus]
MSVYGEILMFFYLFNWKVKLGVILTVGLFLGAVITFVVAWGTPMPKDVFSYASYFISYRWFLFFIVSGLSVGSATMKYHEKIMQSI